jgi:hypothetical protein
MAVHVRLPDFGPLLNPVLLHLNVLDVPPDLIIEELDCYGCMLETELTGRLYVTTRFCLILLTAQRLSEEKKIREDHMG